MQSHKKLILLLIIILSIAMVSAMAALRGQTQNSSDSRSSQTYKDAPTPIQDGVMTEKQKRHSKVFQGYKDREDLRGMIAQRGDVEVVERIGNQRLPLSFDINNYLQSLGCKADAVIIGTVKSKSSQTTDNGKFLFTDYELTTEDVLKNNAAAPINSNANITITRTGGVVKLNGHIARAIDYRQELLETGGRYLLFLKFVPETGAYRSLDSSRDDDSFKLYDNRIQQVSRNLLPLGAHGVTDAASFMNEVHTALNGACSNQGGVQ